jgi:Cu/Ag efflux pump CusA
LRSIISVSVRFRLLVIAIAAGIMVIGVAQLPGMHTDVLPETAPVVVDVQTEALGLSGPEVESLVTVPLEKNLLAGVMGVTDVTSDSIPGLSAIELHFAPGTNPTPETLGVCGVPGHIGSGVLFLSLSLFSWRRR